MPINKDTEIHDPLGYRELARSLLAFQADRCINHASLAFVQADKPDKVEFHLHHAAKHAANAMHDAQEWWKWGEARGLL